MKSDLQMSLLSSAGSLKSWFQAAKDILGFEECGGWPDHFGDSLYKKISRYNEQPIQTLSLFSGAGGLDIGFHDAGFQIIECVELEKAFCQTLRLNAESAGRLSGSSVVCTDIKNYAPEFREIDFIIGGPPCQTFSAAGARAAGVNGTDDERGNLFLQYARLIHQLRPKAFLFENVYRIIGAQQGAAWRAVQASFLDLGYRLHWRILDAADYGTPQFRERLIIIGLQAGKFMFPVPSHGPDSQDKRGYYSAGIALSNLSDLGDAPKKIGGRHGYLLDDIPPGLNYSFYTERMNHPNPIFAWRSKFSDYLYKADPNAPVRTIKAQGGQYTGPFSWESRPFSTNELKRLQTFPDNYIIFGNRQKVIHQLGNSVPPQLGRVLALAIRQQIFDRRCPFDFEYLAEDSKLGFRARKSGLTALYASKAAEALNMVPRPKASAREPYSFSGGIKVSQDLSANLVEGNAADFLIDAQLGVDEWSLVLRPQGSFSMAAKFTYIVNFHEHKKSSLEPKRITLSSTSEDLWALLSTWKSLEKILSHAGLKDDLIQLFGYYQCKRSYNIDLTYLPSMAKSDPAWIFLKKISVSDLLGKIAPIESFCSDFGLGRSEAIEIFGRLKKLGFEIRSSNTNRQIKSGNFLIPYPFPTLNERSLQRFARL